MTAQPPASGASGIMRGMNDPEIKPAPSLPWYRALVTRTPRGRKLRRRLAIVLAVLTLPFSVRLLFGWDLRKTAARFGLYHMPQLWQRCRHSRDCKGTCAWGKPYCMLRAQGSDPADPLGGACVCWTKEQEAARLLPPAGCPDARLLTDDGDHVEWSCSGFDPPDGGDGGRTP